MQITIKLEQPGDVIEGFLFLANYLKGIDHDPMYVLYGTADPAPGAELVEPTQKEYEQLDLFDEHTAQDVLTRELDEIDTTMLDEARRRVEAENNTYPGKDNVLREGEDRLAVRSMRIAGSLTEEQMQKIREAGL